MYFIYGIKNTLTNQYYIGSTENIGLRFNQHISAGLRGDEHNKNLYRDILTLGVENFMFKVIERVDTDNMFAVMKREEHWIRKCNAVEHGYNSVHNTIEYNKKIRGSSKPKTNSNLRLTKDHSLYVYEISNDDGIVFIGSRTVKDETTCIKQVQQGLIRNFDNEKSTVAQFIKNNGGMIYFNFKVIAEFGKEYKNECEQFIEKRLQECSLILK